MSRSFHGSLVTVVAHDALMARAWSGIGRARLEQLNQRDP
jgi:hypothetical protein